MKKNILRRIGWAMLIGFLAGIIVNEITFAFLREDSRPPEVIELVIPTGTADLVAAGEQPPSIPPSMFFVAGDTLVVHNEDISDHTLGPLWIPAGSTASLQLASVENFTYECSFQSTKYFNLDVHAPLTLWVRLLGILVTGIPLGILLSLYAVVAWPSKKE